MFTPRTTPIVAGEGAYPHSQHEYECTYYSYHRAIEAGLTPPCYWDRATRTGSYTNAKEWLKNFREPWEVKPPTYKPVAGDIIVYDGECGHVIFMETDVMTSEYRGGDPNSFRVAKFGDYKATLLGFLHFPYTSVDTVERNENVDQIECQDTALRIRTAPDLSAEIVGHVQLGYYNVLAKKENGYTWYQIEKDRWCANISTIYLPSDNDDIVKDLERYFNNLKTTIKTKDETIENYKKRMAEIHKLSEGI